MYSELTYSLLTTSLQLSWITVYYRIYDLNGPVGLKHPLILSNLPDNKYVGRIDSDKVVPPFNVKNLNLAIASREGYQSIFEAAGAELYTTSSQTALPNKQGLPEDAGSHLTNPVKLKFPIKFEKPQVQRPIKSLCALIASSQYSEQPLMSVTSRGCAAPYIISNCDAI